MSLRADRGASIVAVYALLLCSLCVVLARGSTLLSDENIYFEMARQMWTSCSLEVDNGLDVVHSPELFIPHTIEREHRLYAKYPPLYALVAAPAFAAFGLRGLVLLNALSLGLLLIAFLPIARLLLGERAALFCTLTLPLCVPLFSYGVLILPHLITAACLFWVIRLSYALGTQGPGDPSAVRGLLAGLIGGLSIGVRLQSGVPLLVVAAALGRGTSRGSALPSFLLGIAICLLGIASFNAGRFGTSNPFSYGPPGLPGSPKEMETLGHFTTSQGYLVLGILSLLVLVVFALSSTSSRRRATRLLALALAVLLAVVVPDSRQCLLQILRGTADLLIDMTDLVRGVARQPLWNGWIGKALVQSSPLLLIGVIAAIAHLARWVMRPDASLSGHRPLLLLLSGTSLIVILFIATRHRGSLSPRDVLATAPFSARYLVDIFPMLYLLAWHAILPLSLHGMAILLGLLPAAALAMLIWLLGPSDVLVVKRQMLLYLPLGLAFALGSMVLLRRRCASRLTRFALAVFMVLAAGYGAAITIAEDTRAALTLTAQHRRWLDRLQSVIPRDAVLVGWNGAMHGAYPLRDRRRLVQVDAAVDRGADLLRVLEAFRAKGRPLYYFGLGLDRVVPLIEREFLIQKVLQNPLLFRLAPRP